ncbi:MAG: hypothetical protein ABSG68_26345, partial [Thermoguttaceae bacterium]
MQLLFALTLFLSATLLFVVEPMFAKMVLPLLGGSPSVWNTCLVFYQASLLGGYIYAHLSLKWLGARRQAAIHMALLIVPWLVLPVGVAKGWTPPAAANPVAWLWLLLSVSVGLPFLLISATAPMLQSWFAATGHRSAKDPYFLYAASNLGSMIALLSYPLLIESHLTLGEQAWWWTLGYAVLMVLIGACAFRLWTAGRGEQGSSGTGEQVGATAGLPSSAETGEQASTTEPLLDTPPTPLRRLRWLALSLVPSSLLLGVNSYIATDLASVPLLWVIPLTLYLLSFVLVFSRWKVVGAWMAPVQALLIVVVGTSFFMSGLDTSQVALMCVLHLLALFATAMVCHGGLAADRPGSRYLTEFYLWMSLGGVLGGLLNTLVAPLVFPTVWEYPLMIVAACLLRPWPGGWSIFRPKGAALAAGPIDNPSYNARS